MAHRQNGRTLKSGEEGFGKDESTVSLSSGSWTGK